MRSNNSRNALGRAFTMMELLVVMAIIGILVALLFTGVRIIRREVMKARARNTLQKLAIGIRNLKAAEDWDTFLTTGRTNGGHPTDNDLIANLMVEVEAGLTATGNPPVGAKQVNLQSRDPLHLDVIIINDNIAEELSPNDPRWNPVANPYYPILNAGREAHFTADRDAIQEYPLGSGELKLVDPWNRPYRYIIIQKQSGTWRRSLVYSLGPPDDQNMWDDDSTIDGDTIYGANLVIEIDNYDVPNP